MSARGELRRYVNLLADSWTPPATTEARIERLYTAVRDEAVIEAITALPSEWDCAHGVSEDESFCTEAEDDSHECQTIRVYRDDAEKFAVLVGRVHELERRLAELENADPWHRAVAGLNALVDAGIPFGIAPDGVIENPTGDRDEVIEWDTVTGRWILTYEGCDR